VDFRSWPKVQGKVCRGDSGALLVLLPQLAPMLGLFTKVLVQAVTNNLAIIIGKCLLSYLITCSISSLCGPSISIDLMLIFSDFIAKISLHINS
jgi:hypothetical protein